MVIRKLKKFGPAAFVAALMFAAGTIPVSAQQVTSSVVSGCPSCSSASPFSSTVVSSSPSVMTGVVQSNGYYPTSGSQVLPLSQPFQQTQPLPTSTYVASTVSEGIIPGQSYGTFATASSSPVISSQPVGTFTSMSVSPMTSSIVSTVPSSVTQPVYTQPVYATPATTTVSSTWPKTSVTNGYASTGRIGSGLAQLKAQRAASGGIRGHIGGSLGGARYEGVGWSSQSPQSAIQQCCYWGTRPVQQIGVSRGADGLWYACVLYR